MATRYRKRYVAVSFLLHVSSALLAVSGKAFTVTTKNKKNRNAVRPLVVNKHSLLQIHIEVICQDACRSIEKTKIWNLQLDELSTNGGGNSTTHMDRKIHLDWIQDVGGAKLRAKTSVSFLLELNGQSDRIIIAALTETSSRYESQLISRRLANLPSISSGANPVISLELSGSAIGAEQNHHHDRRQLFSISGATTAWKMIVAVAFVFLVILRRQKSVKLRRLGQTVDQYLDEEGETDVHSRESCNESKTPQTEPPKSQDVVSSDEESEEWDQDDDLSSCSLEHLESLLPSRDQTLYTSNEGTTKVLGPLQSDPTKSEVRSPPTLSRRAVDPFDLDYITPQGDSWHGQSVLLPSNQNLATNDCQDGIFSAIPTRLSIGPSENSLNTEALSSAYETNGASCNSVKGDGATTAVATPAASAPKVVSPPCAVIDKTPNQDKSASDDDQIPRVASNMPIVQGGIVVSSASQELKESDEPNVTQGWLEREGVDHDEAHLTTPSLGGSRQSSPSSVSKLIHISPPCINLCSTKTPDPSSSPVCPTTNNFGEYGGGIERRQSAQNHIEEQSKPALLCSGLQSFSAPRAICFQSEKGKSYSPFALKSVERKRSLVPGDSNLAPWTEINRDTTFSSNYFDTDNPKPLTDDNKEKTTSRRLQQNESRPGPSHLSSQDDPRPKPNSRNEENGKETARETQLIPSELNLIPASRSCATYCQDSALLPTSTCSHNLLLLMESTNMKPNYTEDNNNSALKQNCQETRVVWSEKLTVDGSSLDEHVVASFRFMASCLITEHDSLEELDNQEGTTATARRDNRSSRSDSPCRSDKVKWFEYVDMNSKETTAGTTLVQAGQPCESLVRAAPQKAIVAGGLASCPSSLSTVEQSSQGSLQKQKQHATTESQGVPDPSNGPAVSDTARDSASSGKESCNSSAVNVSTLEDSRHKVVSGRGATITDMVGSKPSRGGESIDMTVMKHCSAKLPLASQTWIVSPIKSISNSTNRQMPATAAQDFEEVYESEISVPEKPGVVSPLQRDGDNKTPFQRSGGRQSICSSSDVSTLPPDSDARQPTKNENLESETKETKVSSPCTFDFDSDCDSTLSFKSPVPVKQNDKKLKQRTNRKRKPAPTAVTQPRTKRGKRREHALQISSTRERNLAFSRAPSNKTTPSKEDVRKNDVLGDVQYLGKRIFAPRLSTRYGRRGRTRKSRSKPFLCGTKSKHPLSIVPNVAPSSSLLAAARIAQEPVWVFSSQPGKVARIRLSDRKVPRTIKLVSSSSSVSRGRNGR